MTDTPQLDGTAIPSVGMAEATCAAESALTIQPILDHEQAVHGVALHGGTGELTSDASPLKVISHGFALDRLLDPGQLAFVRVSPRQLLDDEYVLLPAATTVLTLSAPVPDGSGVGDACHRAIDAGYRLAVDGPPPDPADILMELAGYVATSLHACPPKLPPQLREAGKQSILTDVDTQEDLSRAVELGCDFVRGQFFCTPQSKATRHPVALKAVYLQFLTELSKPELDLRRVAELIRSDVALTFGLLRYINSAWFGVCERIDSIDHAIRLLGERRLRKWGTVVGVTTLSDSKSRVLLLTSIARGRLCEQLAADSGHGQGFELFLVGVMSCLDAILDLPMAQALEHLPLNSEVTAALLGDRSSTLTPYIDLARGCEVGSWDTVFTICADLGLRSRKVLTRYYEALTWSREVLRD